MLPEMAHAVRSAAVYCKGQKMDLIMSVRSLKDQSSKSSSIRS